jgi:hypothetical protein
VVVFDSNEHAQAAYDWINERLTCVVQIINQGGADSAEARVSDASLETVDFAPVGDEAQHLRTIFTITVEDDSGNSESVHTVGNYVTVRQDRFWFIIEANSVLFPLELLEPDLLESLAQKTVDRITGAEPTAVGQSPENVTALACDTSASTTNWLSAGANFASGGDDVRDKLVQAVPEGLVPCQLSRLLSQVPVLDPIVFAKD